MTTLDWNDGISEDVKWNNLIASSNPLNSIVNFAKWLVSNSLWAKLDSKAPLAKKLKSNIISFPPPFPNDNLKHINTWWEVINLISDESWFLDIEHSNHIRKLIISESWREILILLLNKISEQVPRNDFSYDSLGQHLNVFSQSSLEIHSNTYDSLFSVLRFLRTLDSSYIFFTEWDKIMSEIKRIIFENNLNPDSSIFNPLEEFYYAFKYILETNEKNKIIPIRGKS